jgi:hypothetical protein
MRAAAAMQHSTAQPRLPQPTRAAAFPAHTQVNWINSPGVWAWYVSLIVAGWLLASALTNDPGLAWTYVHLIHGVVTYYFLHWTKGSMSPGDPTDQGLYNSLTVWEQMDNQTYGTSNRKFFTALPILLFVLATHGADFRKQPLGLNLVVVLVLLIAKMPALHKVRFFGINQW